MKNLYEEYSSRPISIGLSYNEQKLNSFVERHYNLICSPFERKLDIAADWLENVMYNSDDFSMKIHSEFLSEGINILYPNLKNRAKIVVLIDNLDKAWKVHSNLDVQSKIIFNLLGIHRRLQSDFGNDVSVLIFLRRNIFEYILENQAREPDKLIADSIELLWNDPDMLIRVIEKRFNEAFKRYYPDIYGKYTWESFFASSINNIPIKTWLYNNTLPRPRDLIQFVQKAIEWAINRGHEEILEPDLGSALESYSSFALSQIIAEYAAEEPWLINVLNSFNGGKEIYKFNELYDHIKRSSNISDKSKILEMIATLVNIGFIGVKVNGSEIEFAHSLQTSRKLISLVKNSPQNKKLIFAIHHVFHKYLNIISSDENQNRGPTNIIAWLKNKLQEVL